MRQQARLQILALLFLGAFGFLCLDLDPVRDAVGNYLDGFPDDSAEADSGSKAQAPAPKLIGRAPSKAPTCDCGVSSDREISYPAPEPVSADLEKAAKNGRRRIGEMVLATPYRTAKQLKRSLSDLATAAKLLGLTEAQVEEFTRVIQDVRRDLEDVRRYAGAETYAEESARTLASHSDFYRRLLTPEQQLIFDRYDFDALLSGARTLGLAVKRKVWAAHARGAWIDVGAVKK